MDTFNDKMGNIDPITTLYIVYWGRKYVTNYELFMELWRTERGPDYLRKYGNLIHFIQTFATRTPPSSLPSCAAWLSCCKQSVGPRAVLACYISWRSLSYNHSDSPHIFISLLSRHFFPAFTSIDSDSRHTSWAQYNIFHTPYT